MEQNNYLKRPLFRMPPPFQRPIVWVQFLAVLFILTAVFLLPVSFIATEGMNKANDVYVRLTLPHCQQGDRHFARVMAERITGELIGTSITDTGGACDAITIPNVFPIDTIVDEYGRPVLGSFTRDLADFRDGDKAFRFSEDTIEAEPLLTGWHARLMQVSYSLLFAPLAFVLYGLCCARLIVWAYFNFGREKTDWAALYTTTTRLIFPLAVTFALVMSGLQSLDNPETNLAAALFPLTGAPIVGVSLCVLEAKWLVGYWRTKRAEQLASPEPAIEA